MGWGAGNIGGGSGGGLNFKVVGNPQPANPKDNTIWLNTNVDITTWKFAAEQPENMQPGEVWISTGTASPVAFDALKKNTVMVYPLIAMQMMEDGTLVDVPAKSYQNGEWVDWVTYLYSKGNECTNLTGGWLGRNDSTYYSKGTFNKNADHIKLSGAAMTSINAYVANGVDLTNFSTLNVHVLTGSVELGIVTKGKPFLTANYVAKGSVSAINGAVVGTLDISKFSGVYDVTIWAASETSAFSATFDEVYLK